ncbi:uncharacterized protein LOC117113607 [Anneissia japonica]|uniref:uncharacterized protein LOC117113607 n=1 Tax=Anneissia japonica TaxID=1529436 RepID=UPI00142572A6|nr:uncharacterized protein LOC117113607 [Anneissia japonica]
MFLKMSLVFKLTVLVIVCGLTHSNVTDVYTTENTTDIDDGNSTDALSRTDIIAITVGCFMTAVFIVVIILDFTCREYDNTEKNAVISRSKKTNNGDEIGVVLQDLP